MGARETRVLALALVLHAGGTFGCSPRAPSYAEPCNDDTGCALGLRCQAGACVVGAGPDERPAGDAGSRDNETPTDAGPHDGSAPDAGSLDAGLPDAGLPDAGPPDAGPPDAGVLDAGPPDAGPPDAGVSDAGPLDAGVSDAGPLDAGPVDAGPMSCGDDSACPDDAPFCEAGRCEEVLLLEPVAAIAECLVISSPDPDACPPGPEQIEADGSDSNADNEKRIFLRFDVEARAAGRALIAASLHMKAASVGGSESDSSGEVWLVEPFERADLEGATPAPLGSAPLAGTQGPVALGQEVTWTLSVDDAVPLPPSIHLGVLPTTTNGVRYLDETSASPPRLRLEVR